MDWLVLALAPVLGLVGALVGGLVSPLLTARRTRELWLLQQRAQTYTELLTHVVAVYASVNVIARREPNRSAIVTEDGQGTTMPQRLVVFASQTVLDAFLDMSAAFAALKEGAAVLDPHARGLGQGHPLVVAALASVGAVRSRCREEIAPRPRRTRSGAR